MPLKKKSSTGSETWRPRKVGNQEFRDGEGRGTGYFCCPIAARGGAPFHVLLDAFPADGERRESLRHWLESPSRQGTVEEVGRLDLTIQNRLNIADGTQRGKTEAESTSGTMFGNKINPAME